jgi:hypothetical protein
MPNTGAAAAEKKKRNALEGVERRRKRAGYIC